MKLWTAPVTTGASMTAAVSGGSGFETVGVFQATGYNTSTPIGATATSGTQDITGSYSYSLSGAPASDSYILSILGVETANDVATGVTAGTGWTSSFGYVNAGEQVRAAEYITGVTSTTVLWNNVAISDSAYSLAALAVEIKAATAAETTTVDKWYSQSGLLVPRHYAKKDMVAY